MGESLRDLIFLSNGITSALELGGDVVWFPCPRFDSPTIFCSILDSRKGGHFSMCPTTRYKVESRYMGNSLVVENVFTTRAGKLVTKDFLQLGATAIIRVFKSDVPFKADIDPAFMYGSKVPSLETTSYGLKFTTEGQQDCLYVTVKGKYRLSGTTLEFEPGSGYIVASYSEYERYKVFDNDSIEFVNPSKALNASFEYSRQNLSNAVKVSEFSKAYYRSILVLLGLTYRASWGVIAAATTSMPTVIGGDNNWDYRYVWIRDSSYAIEALSSCGLISHANKVLDFLISNVDVSSKPFVHPLFTVDGLEVPLERKLNWLSGYRNSKPVRIGNIAYIQMQKDCEGDFMSAFYKYFKQSGDMIYLKENMWAIEALAEWASRTWRKPSLSMWEERLEERHFVHTKVMDWVILDRASKFYKAIGMPARARHYMDISREVKADIMRHGTIGTGSSTMFVKQYGSQEVDSSLLMLPLYGFVDADSQVFSNTLSTIERRLYVKGGVLLRNENDFEGEIAYPFTLVNTWLARVYAKRGEPTKARETIVNLLKYSNKHMLMSERVDPKLNEPTGNFPQLFPHAGLIEAIIEYNNR